MARILVVEDEADIQKVLEYNLRQAGYEVLTASRAEDALRRATENAPDAIILDLMLPDFSGIEVCKQLRRDTRTRDVPVLMLTARGEEIDRVVGFEVGADDYVVKPFSTREVLLRVAALLKRRQPAASAPAAAGASSFVFGRLRVDAEAHKVWVDGAEVELTALEFRLLTTLHARRRRVLSRPTLLSDVWGIEADITTRTVDTHVKRLREKLGAAGAYVETVRGVGYRFVERPEDAPG